MLNEILNRYKVSTTALAGENDDDLLVPKSPRECIQLALVSARRHQRDFRTLAEDSTIRGAGSFKYIFEGIFGNAAERVLTSSMGLVNTTAHYRIADQLSVGLEGLGLISTCDYYMFFGDLRICAIYGRAMHDLQNIDRAKTFDCLDRFEQQRISLTKDCEHSQRLQAWIENERDRIKGVPPKLHGFKL